MIIDQPSASLHGLQCLQSLLHHGIETLSQAEVGSALQVYFNLGLLKQVCQENSYA